MIPVQDKVVSPNFGLIHANIKYSNLNLIFHLQAFKCQFLLVWLIWLLKIQMVAGMAIHQEELTHQVGETDTDHSQTETTGEMVFLMITQTKHIWMDSILKIWGLLLQMLKV